MFITSIIIITIITITIITIDYYHNFIITTTITITITIIITITIEHVDRLDGLRPLLGLPEGGLEQQGDRRVTFEAPPEPFI